MKFLLTALASLVILGPATNAETPEKCENGRMVNEAGDRGVACMITRSGDTIRLFRASAYHSNITQIDPDERAPCEAGFVMRITPENSTCISGQDLLAGPANSRIIHVSDIPQTDGVTIFAGGRRRSQ